MPPMKRSSLIILLALLSACVPHPHRHKKATPSTTSPPTTAEPVTEPSTTMSVAVQSTVKPTTPTTHAPTPTTGTPSSGGRALTSTAYCERGTTASGKQTHSGVAAANELPMGSSWKVLETGEVVTIEDRSAAGATQLDIWMSSCSDAVNWGRRTVHVVPA